MNRKTVIQDIVNRDLRKLTLAAEVVQRDAAELYAAACEQFGTWDTALEYAGISVRRVTVAEEFSRQRVLGKIRRLCRTGHEIAATRVVRYNRRLYEAARRHFGTWRLALQAAGINVQNIQRPRRSQQFDRQKIIDELRRRHEAGESVKWGDVCLDNQALALAAKRVFLSWRRATVEAGLTPADTGATGGRVWSRDLVIQSLELRHREGKRMSYIATRNDDCSLVSAARRHFGGWTQALLAAGIEPTTPEKTERGE